MNSFLLPPAAVLVTRILDSKNATEPLIEMTSHKPAFSFEKQGTPLPFSSPEKEGIPSAHICDFLDKIRKDTTLNIHNLLIARNGRLLCDVSFGAQDSNVWKYTFSACKSIVSLAIGMLVDDGLLSTEERIIDIFPKEVGAISKIRIKDLRVEDLLTMRAALQFSEADSMTTTEWLKGFLNSAVKGEIGKSFKYNSIDTYVLAAIVVKKTGKSLTAFLKERLFDPLGIVNYYWERSPQNIEKGGWGLYLLPKDFVKIGHMVLSGGVYEGKRIVSAEYLQLATAKQVNVVKESQLFDYGYQIWVGKKSDSFLFNGMLGQNVVGFKRNGILIIAHAGNGELFQTSSYFHYLIEAFDRDFEKTLPKCPKAERQLSQMIKALSLYFPQKKTWRQSLLSAFSAKPSTLFDKVLGRYLYVRGDRGSVGLMPLILQGVQNEYAKGFESVSFFRKEGIPYLAYCEKNARYEIPLGFDVPLKKHLVFGKIDFLVASFAKFKYNEEDRLVLILRLDFLETPCSRILKFVFKGDGGIQIFHAEAPGEEFVSETVSEMLKQVSEMSLPLVSGVIDRFGEDYVELKLRKAFSPIITAKKEITNE